MTEDLIFVVGHGVSCRYDITRSLDDGSLPILKAVQKEDFMHYYVTAFASLEKGTLKERKLEGTHWISSYSCTNANRLGEEEKEELKDLLESEKYDRDEEVVLCCRVEAVHTGNAPCYAWFKNPYFRLFKYRNNISFDSEKGFYGMIDGKVADPNDFYHSFFLNAGSYVGLKRIAEITEKIDPSYSRKLKAELEKYKTDIRNGFYYAMPNAPVVPFRDGSWVEHNSNISFYADGGNWYSHGTFSGKGVCTGPLWLIISEVLDPFELGTHFLLKHNQFPTTIDNAALSQPYYSRHDFAHIKRGEVKAFLKCYYNQLTGLMDRETYTFWEHYNGAGQHKTHEEAWFLMQTRWMLYLEEGEDIRLFSAIPRKWLEDGKEIKVKNASSYFGKISFGAVSDLEENNVISAYFECKGTKKPKKVFIRVPHPENRQPVKVEGGNYCSRTSTVEVEGFKGKCSVKLFY